jgi:hypothetical protein
VIDNLPALASGMTIFEILWFFHNRPMALGVVPGLSLERPGRRTAGSRPEAAGLAPPASYCAFTHLSDPTSLTDTFEKKNRSFLPSAVPRRSVEIRRGPAFL